MREHVIGDQDNIQLQDTLHIMGIPYSPDIFNGMEPQVGHELTRILTMEPATLLFHYEDSGKALQSALQSNNGNPNVLIAEMVDYEPYGHIGTMFHALVEMENRDLSSAQQSEALTELVDYHLSVSRKAIEATMSFRKDRSPTELWTYFDRILLGLEREFMKVGHLDSQIAQEIIHEISIYKSLQEKLVFS